MSRRGPGRGGPRGTLIEGSRRSRRGPARGRTGGRRGSHAWPNRTGWWRCSPPTRLASWRGRRGHHRHAGLRWGRSSRSGMITFFLWLRWATGTPAPAADLDDLAVAGQVLQPLVDPRAAHFGLVHQLGHGDAFARSEREGGPQDRLWGAPSVVLGAPGAVRVFRARRGRRVARVRSCAGLHRALGHLVQLRTQADMLAGSVADDLVGENVRAGTAGCVVLGCGDEELAGGV